MFAREYVLESAHWWCAENNVDDRVYSLVLFLFENLDALYTVLPDFPDRWASDDTFNMRSGGTHGMYLRNPSNPRDFAVLRSAVSLSGDIFCIVKRLGNLNIGNLSNSVVALGDYLEEFRELRNFYAHLDERLTNLDRHGITGEQSTKCGITYTKDAKGCFHLILVGNTLHFSSNGIPMAIDVGKPRFLHILELAKEIYSNLISHKLHRDTSNYPGVHEIVLV